MIAGGFPLVFYLFDFNLPTFEEKTKSNQNCRLVELVQLPPPAPPEVTCLLPMPNPEGSAIAVPERSVRFDAILLHASSRAGQRPRLPCCRNNNNPLSNSNNPIAPQPSIEKGFPPFRLAPPRFPEVPFAAPLVPLFVASTFPRTRLHKLLLAIALSLLARARP